MNRGVKYLACVSACVWLSDATAVVGQEFVELRTAASAFAALTQEATAPQQHDRDWQNLDDIPALRWISLDGSPPGTYAEYLEQHPLRPARFSNREIFAQSSGLRGGTGVAILVNDELYPQIRSGLTEYAADLLLDGYFVVVETVSGGTPEDIKAWVQQQYEAGCEGIVFVGHVPAAWYRWVRDNGTADVFPCDLFYMDLDGDWLDCPPDGIYDGHSAGNGDEAPEVYVARMYTPTLTWDTEANMLNGYFDKAHRYRVGALTLPWQGLEYIDEDWYGYDYFLHLMYGDSVSRHDFGHLTTSEGYLEQLGLGYHYVHVSAHSGGSAHFFGTRPTESAGYAHVYVYSPAARSARLLLGSDDGHRVWLNGNVVMYHDFYWNWWERGWEADQFQTTVSLNAGWNRLLCKISQRDSDYEFSVRFADLNYEPLDDLLYQTDDPNTHGANPYPEPRSHIGTWLLNGLYEDSNAGTRLAYDYLDGEAEIRPSEGDPAPYGVWERVTRDGCPFDLRSHYQAVYGPGGSATSAEVQDLDPPVFFYNLFACGSGRFTESNYLGGSYIFNTTHGLITVASAKSGSMVNYPYFNGPLGEGQTFGRAYYEWWVEQAPYHHGLRGWIYGMVLSGDPTLSLVQTDRDCNGNGVPDAEDIANGTSEDCDQNWVPDECDVAAGMDCNDNGRPDACDIADGTSADCNQNRLPDECDLAGGFAEDCNQNGVPDECDIADGTSADCNANAIPDECEPDCNGNGIADECDIRDGTSGDCNLNGVPDECDIADGASVDDNANGVPDECELPIRYVDADAPPGGSGLFWPAAFDDLQDALDSAAASGGYVTQIWVAAGTYTPAGPQGDRAASFQLLDGVALYGGFAGDETSLNQRDPRANVAILSGDLNGDDGPGFADNDENSYHVVCGSGCDETAVLDGFTIAGGNANVSSYPNGWGGGMYSQNGSPTVVNCAFTANRAGYLGGGMFNDQSSPALINCTFRGNWSGNHGGGIYNYRSAATLADCLFDGNETESHGGGVYNARGSATLTNCTFSHNAADYGGAVHCENNSDVTIANCVLWGDSAGHGPEIALTGGYDPSTVTVLYSDVAGGAPAVYVASGCTLDWGAGNLDADPLFVDPDGPDNDASTWDDNDFHLAAASPCVDAGDPAFVPAPDERDIDGQVRVWDGDNDGEWRVDMGSDEFGSRLPGDLDGDGDVDLADLAQLLAHYGTTADASWDDGDIDADGDVDLADLAALLAVYGTSCP